MITAKKKNFMDSLSAIPPFTLCGRFGMSLAGMSEIKNIPQKIESDDVKREIVSRSFRDIER